MKKWKPHIQKRSKKKSAKTKGWDMVQDEAKQHGNAAALMQLSLLQMGDLEGNGKHHKEQVLEYSTYNISSLYDSTSKIYLRSISNTCESRCVSTSSRSYLH
jgi:hypothetical protein